MINGQVVPFLEITSANDLTSLLNEISKEAGTVSKSVIADDIKELQDSIEATVNKINSAQKGVENK